MSADNPKLFISYSWSSDDHQAWVIDLAAALRDVGIDVILDKWDLREGQDANAFMERMVREHAAPMIQVAMDLAILTGLRRGDLLALTKANLQDDGIHVRTSKTGKPLIISYSPELTGVLDRLKLMKPHFRQPLISTRGGKALTGDGFGTLWRRAMLATYPEGRETERFAFNDLRSKSASDTLDLAEASARLGHASPATTKRHYIRKPARVKPLR